MSRRPPLVTAVVSVALAAVPLGAQSVISAHSGVVQYVEGSVSVDGDAIQPKFGQFPDVKNDQVLATQEGRAEVLLTPGVFLRVAENSSVKMISNSLADTQIAVVYGSALIEVGELLQGNAIHIRMHDATVAIPKHGLYRFDADKDLLRVYDGEARVSVGANELEVRKGHEAILSDEKLQARSFDTKDTDPFYNWASHRAEYVADANVISARVAANSGYGSSGFFSGSGSTFYSPYGALGGWNWNPFFGMFTFVPATGIYWSPFGMPFYSPVMVSQAYVAPARSLVRPTSFGSGATNYTARAAGTPVGLTGRSSGFGSARAAGFGGASSGGSRGFSSGARSGGGGHGR